MKSYFGIVGLILISSTFALGQAVGDFRTFQTGNWNSTSTWERWDGGSWVNPAPSTPTSSDGVITIMDNHTITVTSDVTVDQVEWDNSCPFCGMSGALLVSSGVTLTVNNGTGDDIRIINDFTDIGLLQVSGTLVLNTGATIVEDDYGNLGIGPIPVTSTTYQVTNGGTHIHTTGTGVSPIPAADWQSGSTCQVNATSSPAPTIDPGVAFHHFIWNGVSQSTLVNLNSQLLSVNGDLTVASTNGQIFQFGTTVGYNLSVLGNFFIQNNSRVHITSTGAVNLSIGGNFDISSTNTSTNTVQLNAATNTTTINVTGNFIKTNSSIVTLVAGSTGTTNLNITGNFSHSGGTIIRGGTVTSGSANIFFVGSGTSTFTNSATISNQVNFQISNPKVVDLGTSAIAGTGSFTLQSGATMRVGSPDGLVASSTTLGNIRNSGTRTYQASGNIVYSGTTQNLGSEWSSTGALNGVAVNLQVINGAAVTNNNTGSTSLVGSLTMTNGSFNIGGSNTLTIQGIYSSTSNGTIGGATTSDLTFSGSGSMGTLTFTPGAENLNNLTVGRTGTLVLGSDLTVGGTINLSFGNLNFSGRTLTMNGSAISSSGTGLISSNTSNLVFGGSTFTGAVPFSGSGNQLNNLTFATPGGAYTWASGVTVNTALNLTAGDLTHTSGLTMASNSTFFKGGGSMTGASPAAVSSFNVTYTSGGNTGLELPSSATALRDLTISLSSGTVSLQSAITVNGNMLLSGGTLSAGTNNISMQGATWTSNGGTFSGGTGIVTFGATTSIVNNGTSNFTNITVSGTGNLTLPANTLNITGNIVNNGTINAGTGITNFNGTTSISGSSAPSFNSIIVSNTLTAPAGTMNVAGDFTNNGTFNHNNGSIVFNGTTNILGSNSTSLFHTSITGAFTAPSATLSIAGNFSNTGTFTNNSGTLLFNGTVSAQSITGSYTMNNVQISNPAGVNNNGTIYLTNTLTLTTASAVFDADGTGSGILTVSSTSVIAGGRIAALPTPANFTGNVTVERFVNGPGDWRYFSMPVTNGNVGMWKSTFPVTGNFSDPSPAGVNGVISSSASSVYFYNSSIPDWVAVGSGVSTASTALSNTVGYSAFTYLSGNSTISTRGPIGKGTKSIPIVNGQFNLVPNPYPSQIDWDNMTITGLSSTVSIRLANGVFSAYVQGGASTNPPFGGWTGEIATGQSFWVESTGATTLNLDEGSKTSNSFQFLRERSPSNLIRIALASETQKDETVVWFPEGATNNFDDLFDAKKMRNGYFVPDSFKTKYLNISSYSDAKEYAINGLATLSCNSSLKLRVTDVSPGKHTISFQDLESLELEYRIVLVDHYLRQEKLVNANGFEYSFDITEDQNSFGDDRFELRFIVGSNSTIISSVTPPSSTITDACLINDLPISIQGQTGAVYQLFRDDVPVTETFAGADGIPVSLLIQKDKLVIGQNNFDLKVSSADGCESFLFENVLSFDNQKLSVPVIDKEGIKLSSSAPIGNQWFFEGNEIEGANDPVYYAFASGNYSVQVSFNSCSIMSQSTFVEIDPGSVQVFPIPATDFINIILPDEVSKSLTGIALSDLNGRSLIEEKYNANQVNEKVKILDVRDTQPGIYILMISYLNGKYTVKVIRK